jgi:uncharacterized membrane protein YtjA (UPF0391 family)
MWCYAAAIIPAVAIAEMLGLGGVPEQAVALENVLFIVLLLAFMVAAFRTSVRP